MPHPLPTIPGVLRVRLQFAPVGGIKPQNVIHFHAASLNEASFATAFDAHYTGAMFDPMSNVQPLVSIGVTDLQNGTAEQFFGVTARHGSGTGSIMPAVCAVLSLHSTRRGPRGRGRVYMGPVTEDKTTGGNIDDTATPNTAWTVFLAAMSADAGNYDMVIASYKYSTRETVISHRVDGLAGTQRRRQDQLR